MDKIHNDKAVSMIADIEGDFTDFSNLELPQSLPILPVRNLVLFPGVVSPILIGRESSMKLIKKADKKNLLIGIICQRDAEIEHPDTQDLYNYGVYAKVIKVLTLPNGNITAIVQGLGRLELIGITNTTPYLYGSVMPAPESSPEKNDAEYKAAVDDLRQTTSEYIRINDDIPEEANFAIKNVSNDIICVRLPMNAGSGRLV